MLCWREDLGRVGFAITDRFGGVSAEPYAALNLATHVGDDPAAVRENRRRLGSALGVDRVAWMEQVHGCQVAVVEDALDPPPQVDALVTRTPGLALAVLVADCTPVLAADPVAGVVGVAHVGRQGLALGVVGDLLAAMRELGAGRIVARVGPAICGRCYPVPAAMREEVAALVPAAYAVARDGQPALAIAAGAVAELTAADAEVQWLPGCSAEDSALFSYRRDDAVTGRYAGVAWLR